MAGAPIPIILTRPEGANEALLEQLSHRARRLLQPIISPLIRIVRLETDPDLYGVDAVIFTSSNAVRAAPEGESRMAFCVGSATTALAAEHGWHAVEAGKDADELVETLMLQEPGRFVHLAGRHRRGQVAERLAGAGHDVSIAVLYEQRALELTDEALEALCRQPVPILPLFSPRTAQLFADQLREGDEFIPVALSRAVAGPVIGRGGRTIHILAAPNLHEMAKTIERIAFGLAWVEGSSGGE
ncbi:uroporphyrinogen-III synthase [Sulfitobacter sp. LCG007]